MFLCSGKECQVHSRLAVEKLTTKKRAHTPAQSQAVVSEKQHTVVPVGKLPWSEELDAALTQNLFLVSDHECPIQRSPLSPSNPYQCLRKICVWHGHLHPGWLHTGFQNMGGIIRATSMPFLSVTQTKATALFKASFSLSLRVPRRT